MNYKEKYEHALETVQEIVSSGSDSIMISRLKLRLQSVFPEIRESEDELTWLTKYIEEEANSLSMDIRDNEDRIKLKNLRKALAWLEKQREPQDKGEISDGYHTFNELYYYRMLYNAAFFNMLPKEWVHKSKRHNDGEECFGGGWFIVMANLPTGQISNHYELKDWDLFQIPEKEVADKWDGHTPQEAADRLHKYLLEKQGEQKPNPYSGTSFEYNGHIWGMCARDNGVDILCDKHIIGHLEKQGEAYTKKDVADLNEFVKEYSFNIPSDIYNFLPKEKQSAWINEIENAIKAGVQWLQKQGEQNPIIEMKSAEESLGIDSDTYNEIVDECIYGENKPADIVEPKFKVGDWIVFNGLTLYINEVVQGYYRTISIGGIPNSYDWDIDNVARLWAIQDAKDGDVLINDFHLTFIFKEIKNNMYISHCSIIDRGNDVIVNSMAEREVGDVNLVKCHPATKKQCDLLFQKMNEAGYEWDAEKKETKLLITNGGDFFESENCEQKPTDKVEPFDEFEGLTDFERTLADICIGWIGQEHGWKEYIKDNANVLLKIAIKKFNSVQDAPFEQKPVWCEEDEKMCESTIDVLVNNTMSGSEGDKVYSEEIDWLKALQQRMGKV